jgi:hypothetical protein
MKIIPFFMLIITLNILVYWVILKMEECINFFHIKTKTCIWRPIFIWFNRQYPSPYSKLTNIILEFDLIVNCCDFLPFDVVNFIIVFCARRCLSYNISKFTLLMGLEDIVKIIILESSSLFEANKIMCL